MIHSLAGGSFKEKRVADFAKVEILEGAFTGKSLWYILPSKIFNEGDEVVVPVGINNTKTSGRIIKIDKNVYEGCSPVPFNRAKEVVGKKI